MALWTIDENPNTDATLNLRAEPWADRLARTGPVAALQLLHAGDPNTPLPQAYPGDPFVIRTINVGPTVDSLHIDGHRFTSRTATSTRTASRRPADRHAQVRDLGEVHADPAGRRRRAAAAAGRLPLRELDQPEVP